MPGFDLWIASPTRYPSHHHAAPTTITVITRTLRERKPPPTPKVETKVFRVSNPDFRINLDPDPDVHRICPKIWMHYLVGISHLAKYRTNRPLIYVRNANKCPKISYSAMVKNMKSDLESTRRSGSSTEVNHF